MSKTYLYVLVSALNHLFQYTGITVVPEGVETFVNVGVDIVSALGILYERYQRGGINLFGVRS